MCGILADGYQQLALKWVFDINGGLASEADYPYIGVTNYCNTTKPVVKFKKVCSPHCISLRVLQFYSLLLMQDSNNSGTHSRMYGAGHSDAGEGL